MEITTYLSIDGSSQGDIEGPCTHEGFEGRIVVLDYNHEVSLPALTEAVVVGGKANHQPLEIEKEVDQTSPKLYQALFRGEKLNQVIIEWYRFENSASQLYFKIELENALVSKIQPSTPHVLAHSEEHRRFSEKVSFVYENITWSYGASGEVLYTQQWLEKV